MAPNLAKDLGYKHHATTVVRPRRVKPFIHSPSSDGGAKHRMRDAIAVFRSFHPNSDVSQIVNGYRFANLKHVGQFREETGDPYITHPTDVAYRVARRGVGTVGVAASLLHDVIEDCNVTYFELLCLFNRQIADLVAKLTKPRLIEGSWAFADEPRFYIYPDEYTPKSYNERAAVYFANLLNDINAVILKIEDNMSNLAQMENLPSEKRDRNIGAMVEHLLWVVPRLFGAEEYHRLLSELQRWGFEIPLEMLPKTPSSSVVVLPTRDQLGPELFRALPPPSKEYLTLYALESPDLQVCRIVELGLPSSVVGPVSHDLVKLVDRVFGSTADITPASSLVHPSLAAHETLLRVSIGRSANFDELVRLAGDVYHECVAPYLK